MAQAIEAMPSVTVGLGTWKGDSAPLNKTFIIRATDAKDAIILNKVNTVSQLLIKQFILIAHSSSRTPHPHKVDEGPVLHERLADPGSRDKVDSDGVNHRSYATIGFVEDIDAKRRNAHYSSLTFRADPG